MASSKNGGGVSSVLSQAKKEALEKALMNPDSTAIRHQRFFSNQKVPMSPMKVGGGGGNHLKPPETIVKEI